MNTSTTTYIKPCKINMDKQSALAVRYDVMSIPTLILFKCGQLVKKRIGELPKARL